MALETPFETILEILEAHGWTLTKIWGDRRVFMKPGKLPILIQVKNKKVSTSYVKKVQEILANEAEGNEEER